MWIWQLEKQARCRAVPAAAIAFLALAVTGCTSQLADLAEPADTPPRPAVQSAYPAVHAMPGPRDTQPLSAEERQRIADELAALRERQEQETTGAIPAANQAAR